MVGKVVYTHHGREGGYTHHCSQGGYTHHCSQGTMRLMTMVLSVYYAPHDHGSQCVLCPSGYHRVYYAHPGTIGCTLGCTIPTRGVPQGVLYPPGCTSGYTPPPWHVPQGIHRLPGMYLRVYNSGVYLRVYNSGVYLRTGISRFYQEC